MPIHVWVAILPLLCIKCFETSVVYPYFTYMILKCMQNTHHFAPLIIIPFLSEVTQKHRLSSVDLCVYYVACMYKYVLHTFFVVWMIFFWASTEAYDIKATTHTWNEVSTEFPQRIKSLHHAFWWFCEEINLHFQF